MVEISASMVMKLRKVSGQGMMDCKKALGESNGNIDEAMAILRKKGLATLEKRAGRETSEGMVVCKRSEDGNCVVMATLCCETDFVSRSENFVAVAEKLADFAMVCSSDQEAENIMETEIAGSKFSDILNDMVSKTGEKVQIGEFARYKLDGPGLIGTYVHFNNKVGAMVKIETADESTASSQIMKSVASDIAMHITATKPLALDKTGIDEKIIEQEKAIFVDQVKNKPENIVEKIIEGKLKKFYSENCLLDQLFVKDDSKTVAAVVAEAGKNAGGQAGVTGFVRFDVG